MADLKNVLVSGELAGAKIVHIERLQVNVVTVSDGGVNINVQQMLQDLEKLPASMREILKKRLKVADAADSVDKSAAEGEL